MVDHAVEMPSVQIFAKLTYRFAGMTEMINGAFMNDLMTQGLANATFFLEG